jgi:type IV pilus assembly protein PilM
MNLSRFATPFTKLITPPVRKGPMVGLDFNHSLLLALELEPKGNRHLLSRFARASVPKDAKTVAKEAADLLEQAKLPTASVAIALSGSMVLVRFIQYPRMTLAELKNSMQYEIEKYIPFQASDMIADFHILPETDGDKKTMKVILVAAKKTEVLGLIEAFQKTHLKIRVIDIHPLACYNAFAHAGLAHQEPGATLLDVGQETSSLLILSGEQPVFIREISLGSQEIVESFQKALALEGPRAREFDLAGEAEKHEEIFLERMDLLLSEIHLSLNYFMNQNPKAPPPQSFYLSGEFAAFPAFHRQVQNVLGLKPCLWNCLEGVEIGAETRAEIEPWRALVPVALGLALRSW